MEEDWLPIDEDAEINVEEIMRKIRAYIAARKLSGGQTAVEIGGLAGDRFDPALYDHLYQAIQASDQVAVDPYVVPSRVPLFGPLLDMLRTKIHEVVIFYTNRLAAKQVAFNVHLVHALKALVDDLEKSEDTKAEIKALQKEVRALKEKLGDTDTA